MNVVESVSLSDLPWARRERADANIRRAIWELEALAVEDTELTRYYLALADLFNKGLRILNAIEDYDERLHSVKVPPA